jgi:hypothetical protein
MIITQGFQLFMVIYGPAIVEVLKMVLEVFMTLPVIGLIEKLISQ